MASVQNDNAPAPPLKSPPTTADSKPFVRQPDANANTFSGGAESQVRRGNPSKRRTPVAARKSKYRGVQWDKNGARWRARLHTDRTRHIGYFESEEDAAMAWDLALLRYFGEKEGRKKLNFGEKSIERYRQEPNAQLQAINSRTAGTKQHFHGLIDQHGNPQDPNGAAVPAYRGVVPHEGGVFKSVLMKNRLNETVGFYASPEEAARAHDCASIQANGWGALTNFPLSDYETDPQRNIIVRLPINQPISLQKISLADQQQQQQASQMAGGYPMNGGGGGGGAGGLPRSSSWYGSIPTNSTGGLGTNGLPPLHRHSSLPANVLAHPGGVAYNTSPGATAAAAVAFQQQHQQHRILRSTSLSSADLSMQPSMLAGGHLYNQQQQQIQHQRTGSVTNLHQLAAAAMAGFNNTQQQQQQQQVMMTTTAPIPHTPVYLMNQPGGIVNPFPAIQAQQQQQQQQQQTMPMTSAPPPASAPNSAEQKKRSRAEIEDPSDAPTNSKSTGGRPSPFATNQNNNNEININAAAAAAAGAGASPNNNNYNHPLPSNNTNTTTANNPPTSVSLPLEAAVAGVRHVPETGQYKAALYLDLGTFGSYDEAVRAYDRAALMSSGFSAKQTHVPLLDAVNRAATAIGGGPPQLLPAGVAGASLRYRGVILRGGSFLASLDIGGKAYELGPFATELDAAKAFDRYSLLLKGVTAVTNFPPWEHLASATEVGAIIDAVGVVAMTAGDNGKTSGGTAPGQTVNQPPQQQQQQQQQQPLVNIGGGGGGLINGGGSGLLTHSNSGAHLVGAGQPLLAPMINASSDLERLQLQLNELQQQALMQQQHVVHQQQQEQQQQQPLLMYTHPGQSTIPLHQVINTNTLPMVRVMSAQTLHMPTTQHQHHPAALASFPSAGNLGLVAPTPVPPLPPPPPQQQQQQQQQNIPTTIQLQIPTSAGMTPPPTTLNHHQHQQQQPAATTAGSSPPILPDQPHQHQHPVSAAVGALAAAAELGQELATAPVSASMPLSALQQPQTAAQAAATSHDQGMLTRTHSMAVIAAAAVANAQATTSNAAVGNLTPHGALTQDTTGAGNAAGAACISTGAAVVAGGGGGGVVGHLTPPVSAFDTGTLSGQPDIGTIDFNNQQPPAGAHGGPLRTASIAAAEATLAADAAAEFVATATDPPT